MTRRLVFCAALLLGLLAVAPIPASAAGCTFTTKGSTMRLDGDCVTSVSIVIPDGMTMDGAKHSITGVDPAGGHFLGAVVRNGGHTANIRNLTVTVSGLADVCDAGADRLRGIMFDDAGGTIDHNVVINIRQVGSGCQEGNSIEVRNCDGDPIVRNAVVTQNTVSNFMKTGIIANCNVSAEIDHNEIGASANQANLAANSIQVGFGAVGNVHHNKIAGNQWCGPSDDAATAILLYESGNGTVATHNDIGGNSDIGIYIGGDHTTVDHNNVSDAGADCNVNGYDIGIGNYGSDLPGGDPATNAVNQNSVSGFDTPYDGVSGKNNKVKKVYPHS